MLSIDELLLQNCYFADICIKCVILTEYSFLLKFRISSSLNIIIVVINVVVFTSQTYVTQSKTAVLL